MKLKIPYQDKISLGYSLARTIHYTVQQLSLPIFEMILTGQIKKRPQLEPQKIQLAYQELYKLLKKDSQNISSGLYPLEVLKPEKATQHFLRYPRILLDGYGLSKRRQKKEAKYFDSEAREFLSDLPEYYQRNFHFQTGGYLTENSADLYEHQVEILFAGGADAMRRLIIPLLKEAYPSQGEALHFLEVAAGTGRLTRFMKLAFPKARITVLDLSDPYLKKAQLNLKKFDRLDFVQGAGENLPFADQKFDAVYSCFLFHELPFEIRKKVIEESARVVKPGGWVGLVDSAQREDAIELHWALEQFPLDFHEPFYKNYVQNPMEGLLAYQGFTDLKKDVGFLSKALLAKRPISA
jgi:ubiquinone/menaquinone biosynthesis C-methylase UbiE